MKIFILGLLTVAVPQAAVGQTPSPGPGRPVVSSIDGLPIGAIPPQTLPKGSCAAFLWSQTPAKALMAMVSANPAQIRFAPGGAVTDLVRISQSGDIQLGLAATSEYAGGDYHVTIDLDIVARGDLTDGAAVPSATLRLDQAGKDTIIVPAAGIVGCG